MTMRNHDTNPSSSDPGLGLYIHIPFCETKCGYCDFYSVAIKDRDPGPLVDRVVRELGHRVESCTPPIRTIFCGGGTPTLLPLHVLAGLLRAIQRVVFVAALEEFTVEANPATIDDEKAQLLVASGVTRVSMGAQSFFASELETLERIHRVEDIPPSVEVLRRNGVSQINLDLI
ncbi:MAG: radical SAM protein, partial [Planctomycetes bacterium]|nr:radical SAM protein [Planctomycetota bacterium]